MYLHSFFAEQPDLDWRQSQVREAMGAMIAGWVERGVDGFRVDAVDRLDKDPELRDDPPAATPFPLPVAEAQQQLDLIHSRDGPEIGTALAAIRAAAGTRPLFGEVYLPGPRLDRYLEQLDRVFSFDLLHAPWQAAALATVLETEAARTASGAGERLAWVISNHDFSRVASRWGRAAVRPAAMLLLTLPGPAFVYQGEELGQADGPGAPAAALDRFGRDAFRHPPRWEPGPGGGFSSGRPWLPVPGAELESAAAQRRDPDSVASLYRRLIAVRRRLSGPISEVSAVDEVLSFRRGQGHRVVLNLSGSETALAAGTPLLATTADAISARRLAAGAGVLLAL